MYIGNLTLIAPALFLSIAAIVVLLLGVIAAKRPHEGLDYFLPTQYIAPVLTAGGLLFAGGVVWESMALSSRTVSAAIGDLVVRIPATGLFVTAGGHAQLTVDPFAAIISFIAFAGTLVVMLLSLDHFGENQIHKAEYYTLLMFATVAASLAAAASDLIAIYLAIEFLSLTSYILAAFAKTDRRSAEAGLKYFLYGAACSAIMLYGMSILFGVTGGNTSLSAIAAGFFAKGTAGQVGPAASGAGWVGIMFVLVGLGFKLALVPFHFWAPDTYEGAPTPVTAFLSVVSKAAGLAVVVRFLMVVAGPDTPSALSWYWVLVVLTVATMFYGNTVAIWQRNIKRMLAYSSIAQVGYLMVGVLTAMHYFAGPRAMAIIPSAAVHANVGSQSVPWDLQGVLIYMAAYLLMNLGAFAVVVAVGKRLGSDAIEGYGGLMRRSPLYACALTIFLVSLAGVPPTAGFLGKLFIFGGAIRTGLEGHTELIVLATVGVVNSVISAYYYLNVVRLMFFSTCEKKLDIHGTFGVNAAVVILLVLTLGLIVAAWPISNLTSGAVYTALVNAPR
ncbi:MAG: NADH-quinone oxidoreductase subunit N [Armatimonadetes bacterium]|nr:NADH-quinone oxidoreductase subunit N [Armatimonadota bacterium]